MPPGAPGYEILPAEGVMAPVLARLHARCFDKPWTHEDLVRLLAMPGAEALMACNAAAAGTPAGFVLSRHAADEGEILTLCVDPAWRRAGVARALMRRAMDRLACAGATRLYLEVALGNRAAHALYTGLGFARVGRRPDYYRAAGGAYEAALLLRADIVPMTADRYDGKGTSERKE